MTDDAERGSGGESARERLIPRRGEERSGLRLLQRAIANDWAIPAEMLKEAPQIATDIARNSDSDRDRLRAVEVLARMARDNIEAKVALDRVERLEAGETTENTGVVVRFVNKISGDGDD